MRRLQALTPSLLCSVLALVFASGPPLFLLSFRCCQSNHGAESSVSCAAFHQPSLIISLNLCSFPRFNTLPPSRPNPVTEPLLADYFMLCSPSYVDLALSVSNKKTYVTSALAAKIMKVLSESKTNQVVIFFTVSDSEHIQGVALVEKCDGIKSNREPYQCLVVLDWYRTMELPYSVAKAEANGLKFPSKATNGFLMMTPALGESVLYSAWNSPVCTLYEPTYLAVDQAILKDSLNPFFCPYVQDHMGWPIAPLPGFIFGANTVTFGEALAKGIFGLPMHMKLAAR